MLLRLSCPSSRNVKVQVWLYGYHHSKVRASTPVDFVFSFWVSILLFEYAREHQFAVPAILHQFNTRNQVPPLVQFNQDQQGKVVGIHKLTQHRKNSDENLAILV